MTNIRSIEIMFLDDVFDMGGSYVLNISDRTFAQFFAEKLNIDIDAPLYARNGSSKGKRLRCFLQTVDKPTVVRTLKALWNIARRCQYREGRPRAIDPTDQTADVSLSAAGSPLDGGGPRIPQYSPRAAEPDVGSL